MSVKKAKTNKKTSTPRPEPRPQAMVVEGLSSAAVAYLLVSRGGFGPRLTIAASDDAAELLASDLRALGASNVGLILGDDHSPFSEVVSNASAAQDRMVLRERLLDPDAGLHLVASASAVMGTWMPTADFVAATQRVTVNEALDRDGLLAALTQCGYQRVSNVEDEGTFAVRGGVIDIFKPGAPWAARIDLFGDEVASIKQVVPGEHGVQKPMQSLSIAPIREVVFTDASVALAQNFVRKEGDALNMPTHKQRALCDEIAGRNFFFGIEALWPAFYTHTETILSAITPPGCQVTLVDPEAVAAAWQARITRTEADRGRALAKGRPQVEMAAHLVAHDQLRTQLWDRAALMAVPLVVDPRQKAQDTGLGDFTELAQSLAQRRQNPELGEILVPLVQWFKERAQTEDHILFAVATRGQAMRLKELLAARRINLEVLESMPPLAGLYEGRMGRRAICIAPLSAGFMDARNGVAILTDHELFGGQAKPARRRRSKKPTTDGLNTLKNLQEGDLIIHQDHGIGRYDGLVRLVVGGVDGDFARLVYAENDKLYLPVYRLGILKRYHGSQAHARLDKLGGARWERAKTRVRDAVLTLAHTLLAMQARRTAHKGFALPKADSAYAAFAASFPFEETQDQQKAIDATLADLQKDVPMDRLVCGDVGYGKTEVALRAAFLTAHGGRQVAVLVPTTVLAEQHRETFASRMAPFGVVVEVLSRFRTPKQSADVLARLKAGAVDVLIGTHRLLSADVEFANLGLMVVDEEQRFGVKHKERLKQLRAHVHVLTLSATPIPRTLSMATSGLRDLSLIQTPPAQRSAIRTEVMRWDDAIISEAIQRELHRGGQVFVVHNRVQSIETMAQKIRALAPKAQVLVAHGQMSADVLEGIMVQFVRREAQVLVCTAIIESGIDIPSANTMIVNRADTFGLSQLYQLRGRIGRGNERAFAYLMLPETEALSREATQRLTLLKRFSELGAGFMVASHDLEMRGAGDLLGSDQSGQIAAVGYELYTELLHEAVQKAKGWGPRQDIEPEIKLSVTAVFPESYMPEPLDRLAYYQRMAQSEQDEGIYEVLSEVRDLFGPPPREALGLVAMMILRRRLRALGAHTLTAAYTPEALKVGVAFAPDAPVDRLHLVELCQTQPKIYRLLASGKLALTLPPPPSQPPLGSEAPQPLPEDLITAVRLGLESLQVSRRAD